MRTPDLVDLVDVLINKAGEKIEDFEFFYISFEK